MDHAILHLHGDLHDLTRTSEPAPAVPLHGRRSVKDAVESLGVPHTEVGLVVVDGESVDWGHGLSGGETVTVWPVERTPEHPPSRVTPPPPRAPIRFVADVHLGTLARRLRLLGLDTWWANDADDPLLARLSVDQARVLLTRDRHLLMRREIVHGVLVRDDHPDRQVEQVVARCQLGDELAPRTRCVTCNGRLEPVDRADVAHRLEPGTLAAGYSAFARCRGCGRVFWPGAHDDALATIIDRIAPVDVERHPRLP